MNAASSISPLCSSVTASSGEELSEACPWNSTPPSAGPPTIMIAGTSSRAAAISMPGTILSQEPRSTTPSSAWPRTIISTAAATISREGSV